MNYGLDVRGSDIPDILSSIISTFILIGVRYIISMNLFNLNLDYDA